MQYCELGKSGLRVSEIGLGCNRLGDKRYPDEHWETLIRRALDLGVTVFDTAEIYAKSRSEEMLGRVIGNRDDVVIASKMNAWDEAEVDLSWARMAAAVEGSLRRLQRDCIDVYQLHSPSRATMACFDWGASMARLQEQGKIRLRAVAVNAVEDGVWLIEQGAVDVLQITYNIFDVSAEERLFDLADAAGVGLLVRLPLGRGVLTGKFRAGEAVADVHRANLDGDRLPDLIAKAEDLRTLGAAYPGGMTRLAHHFSLTPRAVSATIPGARTIEQLEENCAASGGRIAPEMRAEIDRIRAGWGD